MESKHNLILVLRVMMAVFFAHGIAHSHSLCAIFCGIMLLIAIIGIIKNPY